MSEYIPGVCNIGPLEVARRRQAGWVGVAVSAAFLFLFILFRVPAFYRLIIILPASLAATGFLQAYFHFCAAFGFTGVYNLMKPAGQTETVEQEAFRKKDRQKAQYIMLLSFLIGLAVTFLTYLLPF